MSTRIGLISDVHACAAPVQEALDVLLQEKVDMILCAGDIAGYGNELGQTVKVLREHRCQAILGNHDAWYLDDTRAKQVEQSVEYLSQLPPVWESVIEGIHVYAAHASPPQSMSRGVRLLDEHGNVLPEEKELWTRELEKFPFDVLIVGHTHQVFAERLGEKLLINPGSTKFNHTCAVLSLPDLAVRFHALSGKEPLKVWNWGMIARMNAKETDY